MNRKFYGYIYRQSINRIRLQSWRKKIIKYFLNLKNLLYIHSWGMMRTPMFGTVMVEFGERSNYRDKRVKALTYQSKVLTISSRKKWNFCHVWSFSRPISGKTIKHWLMSDKNLSKPKTTGPNILHSLCSFLQLLLNTRYPASSSTPVII